MGECFERFKIGCLMGASVGACLGVIFGTFSAFGGSGARNGVLRSIGKSSAASAASFGFFMGIGSLIRCDSGSGYGRR